MQINCFFILLFCSVNAVCGQTITEDEKMVQGIDLNWLQAIEKRDTSSIKEILSDDFVITYSNGIKELKQDILNRWRKRPYPKPYFSIYTTGTKAVTDKDTIILKGTVIIEELENNILTKTIEFYIDRYFKQNGLWRVLRSDLYNSKPENTN
jgi:hypothetical protein